MKSDVLRQPHTVSWSENPSSAGAQFVPQAETAGQGLDGDEPGMDGVIGIGDELESQSRGSLGDGRHPSAYQIQPEAFTTKNTSHPQS